MLIYILSVVGAFIAGGVLATVFPIRSKSALTRVENVVNEVKNDVKILKSKL